MENPPAGNLLSCRISSQYGFGMQTPSYLKVILKPSSLIKLKVKGCLEALNQSIVKLPEAWVAGGSPHNELSFLVWP